MPRQGDIGERFGECKAIALRADPLTPDDITEARTLIARQKARDEARRSGDTPQATLPLDEAA